MTLQQETQLNAKPVWTNCHRAFLTLLSAARVCSVAMKAINNRCCYANASQFFAFNLQHRKVYPTRTTARVRLISLGMLNVHYTNNNNQTTHVRINGRRLTHFYRVCASWVLWRKVNLCPSFVVPPWVRLLFYCGDKSRLPFNCPP